MLWEAPGRPRPGASCLLSRKGPKGKVWVSMWAGAMGADAFGGLAGRLYSRRCAPVPKGDRQMQV